MLKRVAKWIGGALATGLVAGAAFVWIEVAKFNASARKVYAVPLPHVMRASDPETMARGEHLAKSLGACVVCHGDNLGGGRVEPLGPLGTMVIPNITTGKDGRGNLYSDGELARLIKHGIRRDGTTVRLMPATDWSWWDDDDVVALISWVRGRPPVDGDPGITRLGPMAKVLDRFDAIPFDVARRIDHEHLPTAPAPSADARYGRFLATPCRGCHGEHLSGGPIPGAPPELAVPLNLTPHETGLKGWTYQDFMALIRDGKRKNGQPLNPFMAVEALRNMNELEMQALWAYLQSVPPRPFGQH